MSMLSDIVAVSRRFQRSVRLDTDHATNGALQGYVCHGSGRQAIETMARLYQETGQREEIGYIMLDLRSAQQTLTVGRGVMACPMANNTKTLTPLATGAPVDAAAQLHVPPQQARAQDWHGAGGEAARDAQGRGGA